jgi:hypothetical protein
LFSLCLCTLEESTLLALVGPCGAWLGLHSYSLSLFFVVENPTLLALNVSITEKVLASMANLHFYDMPRGTIANLSIVFHPNFVINFADIYPAQVANLFSSLSMLGLSLK